MLPTKPIGIPPCGGSSDSSSWARRASLLPLPGSAPIVSRPTRGSATPCASCAYATPSWANWTSISGFGSEIAPASIRMVGVGRLGSTTASAGRSTPGSSRSRSRAVVTMAPVDPADTTAEAWPRLTSWQGTAMLDLGRRQLASPPSSMPGESSAATMRISPAAWWSASSGRSCPGRPASTTWIPCCAGGRDRARHDLVRGVVAAHRVNGNDRPAAPGARFWPPAGPRVRRLLRGVAGGQSGTASWSAVACGQGEAKRSV